MARLLYPRLAPGFVGGGTFRPASLRTLLGHGEQAEEEVLVVEEGTGLGFIMEQACRQVPAVGENDFHPLVLLPKVGVLGSVHQRFVKTEAVDTDVLGVQPLGKQVSIYGHGPFG